MGGSLNAFKRNRNAADQTRNVLNLDEHSSLLLQQQTTSNTTTSINQSLQGPAFFLFVMPTFIKVGNTFRSIPSPELCGRQWIALGDSDRVVPTAAEVIHLVMQKLEGLKQEVLGLSAVLLQNGFILDGLVDCNHHSSTIYCVLYQTYLSDDIRNEILMEYRQQELNQIALRVNVWEASDECHTVVLPVVNVQERVSNIKHRVLKNSQEENEYTLCYMGNILENNQSLYSVHKESIPLNPYTNCVTLQYSRSSQITSKTLDMSESLSADRFYYYILLLVLRLLIHSLVHTNKKNITQFLSFCKKHRTMDTLSDTDLDVTLLVMLDMMELDDVDWDYKDVVAGGCNLAMVPVDTLSRRMAETLLEYIQVKLLFSSKKTVHQLTLTPNSDLMENIQDILVHLDRTLNERICVPFILSPKSSSNHFSCSRLAKTIGCVVPCFPLLIFYQLIDELRENITIIGLIKLVLSIMIIFLHYIPFVNIIMYYAFDLWGVTDHPIQLYATVVLSMYTGLIYGFPLIIKNFYNSSNEIKLFQSTLDYAEIRTLNVVSNPLQCSFLRNSEQMPSFALFNGQDIPEKTFNRNPFGVKLNPDYFAFISIFGKAVKSVITKKRSRCGHLGMCFCFATIYTLCTFGAVILSQETETTLNNTATINSSSTLQSNVTQCARNCSLLPYATYGRFFGQWAFLAHYSNFLVYLSASIHFFYWSYMPLRRIITSISELENIKKKAPYFFDVTNPNALYFIVKSMRHEFRRIRQALGPLLTIHYCLVVSVGLTVTMVVFYFVLYHSITHKAILFCLYHVFIFAIVMIIFMLQVLFMNKIITNELPQLLHTKQRHLEDLIAQHEMTPSNDNLLLQKLKASRNVLAETITDLEFTRENDTVKLFGSVAVDNSLFLKMTVLIFTNLVGWFISWLKKL